MLDKLTLRDFRCFDSAHVELHAETTIFTGRNGQGKTSLIEAACVLLRLHSPRTSSREELVRFGAPAAVVEGRWNNVMLRCAQSAKARRLALDGVVCTRSADYLSASGVVVWMDHGDMNMLRAGAEHRRRFLDFTGSQLYPDYLNALRAYDRALRGRNYALKKDAVIAWRQADAFARVMSEHARVLRDRRAALIELLSPEVSVNHLALSGAGEAAAIEYLCGYSGVDLFDELLSRRSDEERTRSTACGTHRDDVGLSLNGRDAGSFASEGQQRTLALAMKLAQAQILHQMRGQPPLLLIDDVFGELDRHRRRALMVGMPKGTQKVITTTHLDWLEESEFSGWVYEVDQGGVGRVKDRSR